MYFLCLWQGDIIQRTLHIYLKNNDSTSDLLDELGCSVLTQVHMFLWQNLSMERYHKKKKNIKQLLMEIIVQISH